MEDKSRGILNMFENEWNHRIMMKTSHPEHDIIPVAQPNS